MATNVMVTQTVYHELPTELVNLVNNKIKEMEKQGMKVMIVRYLNQNYNYDAKTGVKLAGATKILEKKETFVHTDGKEYEIGLFEGRAEAGKFRTMLFNPKNGMLSISLSDRHAITFITLFSGTKGSPFNKDKEPIYEITSPLREKAVSDNADEVKKYVEHFIDRKLHSADLRIIGDRFGVKDYSDIKMAKRVIKQSLAQPSSQVKLEQTLLASCDAYKPFAEMMDKVYALEYVLDTDSETGVQRWMHEDEVLAEVGERDATTLLSLLDYHLASNLEKKIEVEPTELKGEETKPTPPPANKQTTTKK